MAPEEAAIAAELALKPLFDRLSALLGQAAGILLLSHGGRYPERERLHLVAMRRQCAATRDRSDGAPARPGGELRCRRAPPLLDICVCGRHAPCRRSKALLAPLIKAQRITTRHHAQAQPGSGRSDGRPLRRTSLGHPMADYSLWVLEYASQTRVSSGDILYGSHGGPPRRMPYCYVVLRSRDHVAMVDVG
jgi:hypothetical protein